MLAGGHARDLLQAAHNSQNAATYWTAAKSTGNAQMEAASGAKARVPAPEGELPVNQPSAITNFN